jgi:hypothetical protein
MLVGGYMVIFGILIFEFCWVKKEIVGELEVRQSTNQYSLMAGLKICFTFLLLGLMY